ncbi:MAG: cytochrome b N-terminal domain-containing protein [Phycisphaeraceae bacterium]
MKRIADWFDQRIGYRGLIRGMLYEQIPGGARWRYVWGSTLVFCFLTQVVTGIFLWMAYSPSSQTAWESVYYIQHEMSGGWLLRGIHHFTAQAMIILLVLHVMQVIIDGAYKAPREVNFWIGLILLQIVLGLSLTGYLLPWDQKGYWATKVATSLIEAMPLVGPTIQKIVIGGHDYGHHTLSRFFALHAGVLPAALVLFLIIHVYAFRRHGITAKLDEHKSLPLAHVGNIIGLVAALAACYWLFRAPGATGIFDGLWPGVIIGGGIILLFWLIILLTPPRRKDTHFWPDQVLKDAVACLAVLSAVIFLTCYLGAPLAAPADATAEFSAARPEWYFLFLFQLLKYFPGELEIIGAVVVPGAIMGMLVLMPFIGKTKVGHAFNVLFVLLLLAGAGYLTYEAISQDKEKPEFNFAVRQAEIDGHRAVQLAGSPSGIPTTGALTLVRDDPRTMGPRLFAANCASCHRFGGHDGMEGDLVQKLPIDPAIKGDELKAVLNALQNAGAERIQQLRAIDLTKITALTPAQQKAVQAALDKSVPTAADLKGFATRKWLTEFFDPKLIATHQFFGGTKFADGKMVETVTDKDVGVASYDDAQKKQLAELIDVFDQVASWDGPITEPDPKKAEALAAARKTTIDKGMELMGDDGLTCLDCHKFYGEGKASGVDLTDYRSRAWIRAIISNPRDVGYKNKTDANDNDLPGGKYTMPAFHKTNQLDEQSIDLLARWLRGEWYEPK